MEATYVPKIALFFFFFLVHERPAFTSFYVFAFRLQSISPFIRTVCFNSLSLVELEDMPLSSNAT